MSEPSLLVITPSRGRPQNAARLLNAIEKTSRMMTRLAVGVDDDDPELERYQLLAEKRPELIFIQGPRQGLAAWTDQIALRYADEYPFIASLGDDMVPRTRGWDEALVKGVFNMGGTGFTYPWDGTREDIPEAVVMSSDIIKALGWMCLPGLSHWYIDNVWADLGRGAGCLRHLRAIAVDHLQQEDQTSRDNAEALAADREVYYGWRKTRMAEDIRTVMELRGAQLPQPA